MKLPRIQGIIRRRLLVNFRVDPTVIARQLPEGLVPKLHEGHAIAEICLIRLEKMRLPAIPIPVGGSSENAAHRIAVRSPDGTDAVYVPRRDSDSWINHLAGGRVFPGEQHRARFEIDDDGDRVKLSMRSVDGDVSVDVTGRQGDVLPAESVFESLAAASDFFEVGALGYSSTSDPDRYHGMVLDTRGWRVDPFLVSDVFSSYFEDRRLFPDGSATFDHALVMRNLEHEWRSVRDYRVRTSGSDPATAGRPTRR